MGGRDDHANAWHVAVFSALDSCSNKVSWSTLELTEEGWAAGGLAGGWAGGWAARAAMGQAAAAKVRAAAAVAAKGSFGSLQGCAEGHQRGVGAVATAEQRHSPAL